MAAVSDAFLTPIAQPCYADEPVTLGGLLGLRVLYQDVEGWPKNGFSHFVWHQGR